MSVESDFNHWQDLLDVAEKMRPIIKNLYDNRGVDTLLSGQSLARASAIEILEHHKKSYQKQHSLMIHETWPILAALSSSNIQNAQIDLGRVTIDYWHRYSEHQTIEEYLESMLTKSSISYDAYSHQDVVLYGFGRIGRILARLMIEQSSPRRSCRLRAVVVRPSERHDLVQRADLLMHDSIHGPFQGVVEFLEEDNCVVINGNKIQFIFAQKPSDIDYTEYGIENALIVDNTGHLKTQDELSQHLEAKGASKVVLTAPTKDNLKHIVYGVNESELTSDDRIISAASCTTNAIAPVLKIIDQQYGIIDGHIETVHSYTNDQNLIDNYHKGGRRGRSAVLNMVITSTGAAKAVEKVLPNISGKLTANAIRVPTPNVSMAVMHLTLSRSATVDSFNKYIQEVVASSSWNQFIDPQYSDNLVSSDLIGSPYVATIDLNATITTGNRAVLYVWYDNEYGYSCQVIKVIRKMLNPNEVLLPS